MSSRPNTELPKLPFWRQPVVCLAVGFGTGWAPKAPGTFGTLLGLPLAWAVGLIENRWIEAAVVVALCLAAVPISAVATRAIGRGKDPGCIVIDEIVSLPVTFFLVPMTSFTVALAGFLLFRFFDISKLPPARQLEQLPGGWGVAADDWAAAVYSNLGLHLLLWAIPQNWII